MKKYLYTFLIVIIIIGSLVLINNLGIISFRQWGEDVIQSTPFVKEYVRTAEEYDNVVQKNEMLREEKDLIYEELKSKEQKIAEMGQRIVDLQSTNEELNNIIEDFQKEEVDKQENFEKLLKIYENMQPDRAADILNTLDKESALKILRGLSDKEAANILESMEVEDAAEFSKEMQN
ncbi:MAG: hypothetical protein U5K53_11215 [Halanaerobiales bacterium]|nr:hypothetical protein [Halanaerobiales bacterium]